MKKYYIVSAILITMSMAFTKLYQLFPNIGEVYYSQGINKYFIQKLSRITGVLPFSLFEILIGIGMLLLLIGPLLIVFKVVKVQKTKLFVGKLLGKCLCIMASVYFIFTTFWGLNYNRPHLGIKQDLIIKERGVDELVTLYNYLLDQAALARAQLQEDPEGNTQNLTDWKGLFDRASIGYERASDIFPEVSGSYGKPKPIAMSKLMNYTGIMGIYFPFTGEANVNVAIPKIMLPVTTLHEMAHQRGYTGEDECNFLGYIAAINHPDSDFQYSGYMLSIIHVGNSLYEVSPEKLWEANKRMAPEIRKDLDEYNRFWDSYEGEIEELSSKVNNTYLKTQGVDEGVKSYGKMVDLLLAFYEKEGYGQGN